MSVTVNQKNPTSSDIASHWVASVRDARKAAEAGDPNAVWIVRKKRVTESLVREVAGKPMKRSGQVLLLNDIRPLTLPVLESKFKRVAFLKNALPKDELTEVLSSKDRRDRIIGGAVDPQLKVIVLWRGDLRPIAVSFGSFAAGASAIQPDFRKFSVADFGTTLRFGKYEAAVEAVLYEVDPEFRRRLKKRRLLKDTSLGGAIRRLRKQRQLTRHDFRGLDAKTVARIETGKVTPRRSTLETIAKTLGVTNEELATY